MPEEDCSKHLKKVTVALSKDKLKYKQHSNLIAALCRQIAIYTDGYCAAELADDADIVKSSGMVFWFTTVEKQDLLKSRLNLYLAEDIYDALTATKG